MDQGDLVRISLSRTLDLGWVVFKTGEMDEGNVLNLI